MILYCTVLSLATNVHAQTQLATYYETPKNRLPHNKVLFTQSVYDLMMKCWEFRPENRPSFSKLSLDIGGLLTLAQKKEQS